MTWNSRLQLLALALATPACLAATSPPSAFNVETILLEELAWLSEQEETEHYRKTNIYGALARMVRSDIVERISAEVDLELSSYDQGYLIVNIWLNGSRAALTVLPFTDHAEADQPDTHRYDGTGWEALSNLEEDVDRVVDHCESLPGGGTLNEEYRYITDQPIVYIIEFNRSTGHTLHSSAYAPILRQRSLKRHPPTEMYTNYRNCWSAAAQLLLDRDN